MNHHYEHFSYNENQASILAELEDEYEEGEDDSDLYSSWRRNDPRATEIDHYFPPGYGIPLGVALQGNTHVTKLTLELESLLLPTQDPALLTPHYGFLQGGPALRVVTLICDEGQVADSIVRRVLLAAAASTMLEELHCPDQIDMLHHVDAFFSLLQQSQSLRALTACLSDHGKEVNMSSVQRVVAAFRANQILQSLSLFSGHVTLFLVALLHQLSTYPQLKELKIYHLTFCNSKKLKFTNLDTFL